MNSFLQISFWLIINVIYTFSIYLLMKSFFQTPKNVYIEYCSYLIYYFVLIIFSFVITIPLLRLSLNVLALFLLSLNYKSFIKNRFLYILFIYIMLMSIESLIVYLTGFNPNTLGSAQIYYSIYGKFLISICTFLWALSMKKIRFHRYNDNISWHTYIGVLSSTIITFSLFIIILYQKDEALTLFSIFLIIAATFCNITVYDSISKDVWLKYKYKEIENQNNYLEAQHTLIQKNNDYICKIKHDMNNHLFAIDTLLKNKNYEEAQQYIQKLAAISDIKKIYIDTDNYLIDSLINYKINIAQSKGIKCTYKIVIPSNLHIDSFAFVTILSNLLDNAIQGAESHPTPRLNLFIKYTDKGILLIKLANNYSNELLYSGKKFVTTKKMQSFMHGHGLENIENAIRKLSGTINYDVSNDKFVVNIMIYIDDLSLD